MSDREGDILDYGDRAIGEPVDKVLDYEKPGDDQGAVEAKGPKKEEGWEARMKRLGRAVGLKNVGIEALIELTGSKNPLVQSIYTCKYYGAWTMSSTKIYVDDETEYSDNDYKDILYHEKKHIEQFQANNNSPPKLHSEMLKFETAAYKISIDRYKARGRKAEAQSMAQKLVAIEAMLKDVADGKLFDDPANPPDDKSLRVRMISDQFLPAHKVNEIGKFYQV
jgi:hypothetical protein